MRPFLYFSWHYSRTPRVHQKTSANYSFLPPLQTHRESTHTTIHRILCGSKSATFCIFYAVQRNTSRCKLQRVVFCVNVSVTASAQHHIRSNRCTHEVYQLCVSGKSLHVSIISCDISNAHNLKLLLDLHWQAIAETTQRARGLMEGEQTTPLGKSGDEGKFNKS